MCPDKGFHIKHQPLGQSQFKEEEDGERKPSDHSEYLVFEQFTSSSSLNETWLLFPPHLGSCMDFFHFYCNLSETGTRPMIITAVKLIAFFKKTTQIYLRWALWTNFLSWRYTKENKHSLGFCLSEMKFVTTFHQDTWISLLCSTEGTFLAKLGWHNSFLNWYISPFLQWCGDAGAYVALA